MKVKVDKIAVYTTPSCQQCKMTIEQLTAKGLTPTVVDLTNWPALAEKYKAKGLLQAPIVEVTSYWSGFQPDLINQLTK